MIQFMGSLTKLPLMFAMGKQENLAICQKILLKKGKKDKKKKNLEHFPFISSQKFAFSDGCEQICISKDFML